MKKTSLLLLTGASISLSGCAIVSHTFDFLLSPIGQHSSGARQSTLEAPLLQAQEAYKAELRNSKKDKIYFIQPKNKSEKCVLKSSELEGLSLEGASLYWDGQCSNGKATGMGRVIAISKETHQEKILSANRKAYVVKYFNNGITIKGVKQNKSEYVILERFINTENYVLRDKGLAFGDEDVFYLQLEDTLSNTRTTEAKIQGLSYLDIEPLNLDYSTPVTRLQTICPTSEANSLDPSAFKYPVLLTVNNQNISVLEKSRVKFWTDDLLSPYDYWGTFKLSQTIRGAKTKLSQVKQKAQPAVNLEKQYISKLKNGSYVKPVGLSSSVYRQILSQCTETLDLKEQMTRMRIQMERQAKQTEATLNELKKSRSNNGFGWGIPVMATPSVGLSSSIPEVAPMNNPSTKVYRVQRVNDNMSSVQRVR